MGPIKALIPKGSLLDPSDSAAVVGGNVLTSQRIVDVVLKAFSVCAASQVCMMKFAVMHKTTQPLRQPCDEDHDDHIVEFVIEIGI